MEFLDLKDMIILESSVKHLQVKQLPVNQTVMIPVGDNDELEHCNLLSIETSLSISLLFISEVTFRIIIMILRGLIAAAIVQCIVGPPVDKKAPGMKSLKYF